MNWIHENLVNKQYKDVSLHHLHDIHTGYIYVVTVFTSIYISIYLSIYLSVCLKTRHKNIFFRDRNI